MRKIMVTIMCSFLMVATSAFAENYYAGFQYYLVDYEETGVPSLDLGAVGIKGGYLFDENFGIEGRIGFGVSDDSAIVLSVPVDLEIDTFFGIYLRGQASSEQFRPYFLVGYTNAEATITAFGIPVGVDESDLSFGIGIDFMANEQLSIGVEYAQFIDKPAFEISSTTIGLTYFY